MRRRLAGKQANSAPNRDSPKSGSTARPGAPLQGARVAYTGDGGPVSSRLRSLRPRVYALVIAAIGGVLISVNDRTVQVDRHYYPMLMLFGPVCVLVGVAGAICPPVLKPAEAPDDRTRAILMVILIALVLTGLGGGWAAAHFRYHIW